MFSPAMWFDQNIVLLTGFFGNVTYDDLGRRWLRIERFPLPEVFFQRTTRLLLTVPFPHLDFADSYDYYVDRGLQRRDGETFFHVFDDDGYNDLYSSNYARISFHLDSFRPSADVIYGDTFVDIIEAIYNFLGQKFGGR